jgi:hypothetical protein
MGMKLEQFEDQTRVKILGVTFTNNFDKLNILPMKWLAENHLIRKNRPVGFFFFFFLSNF